MAALQRLSIALLGATILLISGMSSSHAELNGIPIWTAQSLQSGQSILVPYGLCRSDIEPETKHDCLLEPGMALFPDKPCSFGHPDAFAWGLPLDVNHHSAQALEAISGIGPATANAIVSYRVTHGEFQKLSDLQLVKGIGPATLKRLQSAVQIQPESVLMACPFD